MSYLQTQIENLLRLAGEKSKPDVYHETLQYISLDGTQYFNPDLLSNADYTIEARFKLTDSSYSSSVFGGRNSSSNPMNGNQLHYIYTTGKTQYIGGYSASELAVTDAITVNDVCEVVCDKTGFSIAKNSGTPTKYSRAFSAIEYTTDLMIGATYTKTGNSIQWGFRGEYYTFKVRLNGELIRDYVPALDNKMRPCLYDKVSKTFLYAKKLSGGATAYDLGFKRWNKFDVDYIQSTGTQYINTGFKFTNTSAFEITCAEVGDFESSTVLCGARNNTDTTSNARIVDYSYSAPSVLRGEYLLLQRGGYDVSENVLYIPYDTEFHTYYQSPTRMSIDDTDRPTVPSLTSPNMDFYIFWQNVGTATAPAKAKIKVKNLKLWDNEILVRDYKPVVWHNGDTTAEACLYDEVYNKMYPNLGTGSLKAYITNDINYNLMSYTYMNTHGYYISATGVVTAQAESDYTDAIAVEQGDIVTLTISTTSRVSNKRIHGYNGTSTSDWVSQLGVIEYAQAGGDTRTLSVVVPSGVSYIRISHSIYGETQCDLTIVRTYEVGTYIQTLKTSTAQGAGYMVDLGIEPKDGIGYHIKTSTNSNSSNYVFGARKATSTPTQQSTKPILIGLTGSQTGATILSSVMGASATWKSDNTNWTRPNSSTSSYVYECSMQTYKENNELKFNIIGYNYNLAKDADRQTLIYTDAIDNADEADMSTLHIGGLNVNNILNGNNAYFFIECRQPNTDMTLLPVVNNNQLYLIDNKTKQTYQFYKVGSPTPATDNIRIKKLDGTFIDGTL